MSKKLKIDIIDNIFTVFPQNVIDRVFDSFRSDELIQFFESNGDRNCSRRFWKRRIKALSRDCYIYEHLVQDDGISYSLAGYKEVIQKRNHILTSGRYAVRTYYVPLNDVDTIFIFYKMGNRFFIIMDPSTSIVQNVTETAEIKIFKGVYCPWQDCRFLSTFNSINRVRFCENYTPRAIRVVIILLKCLSKIFCIFFV